MAHIINETLISVLLNMMYFWNYGSSTHFSKRKWISPAFKTVVVNNSYPKTFQYFSTQMKVKPRSSMNSINHFHLHLAQFRMTLERIQYRTKQKQVKLKENQLKYEMFCKELGGPSPEDLIHYILY